MVEDSLWGYLGLTMATEDRKGSGTDQTSREDYVARDKIVHGDEVHGDKVTGDKIAIINSKGKKSSSI